MHAHAHAHACDMSICTCSHAMFMRLSIRISAGLLSLWLCVVTCGRSAPSVVAPTAGAAIRLGGSPAARLPRESASWPATKRRSERRTASAAMWCP